MHRKIGGIHFLRLWQKTPDPGADLMEIATNGGTYDGLSDDDIDDLCEDLNMGSLAHLVDDDDYDVPMADRD